jgi:hypothetical protein
MELKTARLTLLIDPNKKAAFERLCARQDRTASQVVRQLIRDYLAAYDVDYVAAGADAEVETETDKRMPAPDPRKAKSPAQPVPAPGSRAGSRRR